MSVFYRQEMTIGGDFAQITAVPILWAKRQKGEKRRRRQDCKPTTEAQAWLNKKNAKEHLFFLAHENFNTKDYAVGLGFEDRYLPKDLNDLKRLMRNFWNRLRRAYKKHGIELRYIWIPEMSGRGRYHVHCFLSGGVPREEIEQAWRLGNANCHRFQYSTEGLQGYCNYVVKSPILAKSWCGSRNLRRPRKRCSDYILQRKDVLLAQLGDFSALEQRLRSWSVTKDWEATEYQIDEPSLQIDLDWAVSGSEVRYNEVNGLPYLYIRLYRRGAKLSY